MLPKLMKWGFIPILFPALWWFSPLDHGILLGLTVSMGAIWAVQRSSKPFGEACYATVPR
ncbi:MAG TPA: hypothetical protein VMW51_06990 [Terriglobia bacterium]|nr:hypothetical protein [Terriglobia bacterium]